MRSVHFLLAAITLAVGACAAAADTATIDASTDVFFSSIDGQRDNTYENDGGVYVNTGSYYGAIEWDISAVAVPITNAHVELYLQNDYHNADAIEHRALLLSPAGISGITYNNENAYTETPLDSLGSFSQSAGLTTNQWYSSAAASASDVDKLEALRTGSGKVTMMLYGASGMRYWGEAASFAPRLVLNAVPEPGTIILLGTGLLGVLCYAWQRRK